MRRRVRRRVVMRLRKALQEAEQPAGGEEVTPGGRDRSPAPAGDILVGPGARTEGSYRGGHRSLCNSPGVMEVARGPSVTLLACWRWPEVPL